MRKLAGNSEALVGCRSLSVGLVGWAAEPQVAQVLRQQARRQAVRGGESEYGCDDVLLGRWCADFALVDRVVRVVRLPGGVVSIERRKAAMLVPQVHHLRGLDSALAWLFTAFKRLVRRQQKLPLFENQPRGSRVWYDGSKHTLALRSLLRRQCSVAEGAD